MYIKYILKIRGVLNMQFSKVRKNQHQTHFEDLVLLGKEGLDELNDKIEGFISTLEDKDVGMNTTTKIDGCLSPDTVVATTEGDVTFAKIIDDYMSKGKIYHGYGFNESTQKVEIVELSMPRVKNGEKEWCTLEFDNGGHITATVDHPIKVGSEYIAAIDIDLDTKIDGIDQFL